MALVGCGGAVGQANGPEAEAAPCMSGTAILCGLPPKLPARAGPDAAAAIYRSNRPKVPARRSFVAIDFDGLIEHAGARPRGSTDRCGACVPPRSRHLAHRKHFARACKGWNRLPVRRWPWCYAPGAGWCASSAPHRSCTAVFAACTWVAAFLPGTNARGSCVPSVCHRYCQHAARPSCLGHPTLRYIASARGLRCGAPVHHAVLRVGPRQ